MINLTDAQKTWPAVPITGYVQGGTIHTADHQEIGYTKATVEKAIKIIKNPNFLYARWKKYGIQCYGRDNTSPTGVINIGGIPNELEFLLTALGKTSSLSPTEDLRTGI